jgi:hypothetical protein
MAARRLRVLLAEKRLSETGIIPRSIGADVGWTLELVFAETKEAVQAALVAHYLDLVLLDLALLQPDAGLTFIVYIWKTNKSHWSFWPGRGESVRGRMPCRWRG